MTNASSKLGISIVAMTAALQLSFICAPISYCQARIGNVKTKEESSSALASSVSDSAGSDADAAERVGADDLVEIAVAYCPELSRNFRVGFNGNLALPLLHQPLAVAGLTPLQIAHTLTAVLLKENILAEPIVNVSVVEYRSRPISIVGAVNHPINYQATGRTTLIEALAKAGGLSPTAGTSIIISERSQAGGAMQVHTVAVRDVINGTEPQASMALRGGEEIRVPEANKIFVAGNVRRPGAYPMQSDSDTTVMKAVALSSGLETYSSKTAYIYRKRGTGTERDEVAVPLRQIMTRHAPDVALLSDDILYIPTADGKKMTSKFLGQLAGFGQTAEAGLLVVR